MKNAFALSFFALLSATTMTFADYNYYYPGAPDRVYYMGCDRCQYRNVNRPYQQYQAYNYYEDNMASPEERSLSRAVGDVLQQDGMSRNVNFSVDNGTVTLTGSVNNSSDKKQVESKVQQVSGVKKVVNNLNVSSSQQQSNF